MALTKNEIKALRRIKELEGLHNTTHIFTNDFTEVVDRLVAIEYVYYDTTELKLTAVGAAYEKRSRRYLDGD